MHGSERCWRKFLGAGRFYGVQALIMGGDLTGKAIVPIESRPDGSFSTTFIGETGSGTTPRQLDELLGGDPLQRHVSVARRPPPRSRGCATTRRAGPPCSRRPCSTELRRWIELADERMAEYGIDVYVMPGNDDPWPCDAVLEAATHVQACDDRVVRVGPHEMISCGYANPTPWNSPRELDEDALYARLRALADQLEDPESGDLQPARPAVRLGPRHRERDEPRPDAEYVGGQPHPIPVG